MSRRRTKEKGMFEAIYSILPKSEHMTEEEAKKERESGELRKKVMYLLNLYDLADRLKEEYRGERTEYQCFEDANYLLSSIPEEIMPNLMEWLDNEPISEIKAHGVSVKDVLDEPCVKILGDNAIISVFECFSHWEKDDHYRDLDFCHNYFAIL